jgi:hypothetical protein
MNPPPEPTIVQKAPTVTPSRPSSTAVVDVKSSAFAELPVDHGVQVADVGANYVCPRIVICFGPLGCETIVARSLEAREPTLELLETPTEVVDKKPGDACIDGERLGANKIEVLHAQPVGA